MSNVFAYPHFSFEIFAILPPETYNCVVFGMNSGRPTSEVQEVVYVPAAQYPSSSRLKCTHIEINQVSRTYASIISKPAWTWGGEMGANECGVCIGVKTSYTEGSDSLDSTEKLLGIDLVRLGLERAKTAVEAVHVITDLLELHGQSDSCLDTFHNLRDLKTFLIADPMEVWIVETVKKFWAAERVLRGVRNISHRFTIGTKIDLMSSGLQEYAEQTGLWHPSSGPFNFSKAFDTFGGFDDYMDSLWNHDKWMDALSGSGNFKVVDMFKVLRDEATVNWMQLGTAPGSQVSILRPHSFGFPSIHWFTGTPEPTTSVFKPFIFTENCQFPQEVVSPVPSPGNTDRRHTLYRLHEKWRERTSYSEAEKRVSKLESKLLKCTVNLGKCDVKSLFKYAVEKELKLYA